MIPFVFLTELLYQVNIVSIIELVPKPIFGGELSLNKPII